MRVRKVAMRNPSDRGIDPEITLSSPPLPIGATGEVIGMTRFHIVVCFDDQPANKLHVMPYMIEPIPDATELGTWEQVQAICKWTPSTVKA